MAKKFGGAGTAEAEEVELDPVAAVERELGDALQTARRDYIANDEERKRLQDRRRVLLAHKGDVELEHQKRLIEHGKGIKGAAERRKQSDADLREVDEEIAAVDAAIFFEDERSVKLSADLNAMENRLVEARRQASQKHLTDALMEKKEAFIASFINSCLMVGELIQIAEELILIDGRPLVNQVLEDLLFRTNRILLLDRLKYREPQSTLDLARREFPVTALLPPPESDAEKTA